tara:strand:- start:41 stop:475 length:435 start_codon:yes stop_codon:yes gene_type:complete
MKKTNTKIAIFLILLLLNSCSSVSEGLGGTKKKGSDEFLIEKKAPLVLPPNFGELPEPRAKIDRNSESNNKSGSSIEDLIGKSSTTDANIENNKSKSTIEKTIIEKINKKKIKVQNSENVAEVIEEKPKKKNFLQKFREKFTKK